MQIKHRRFLVLTLIGGQLLCMLFGVAWATGWLKFSFDSLVRNRIRAENRSLAWELATQMAMTGHADFTLGTPAWEQAQKFCEDAEVPHAGSVVVFGRRDGKVLCHTHLGERPWLADWTPGRTLLDSEGRIDPLGKSALDHFQREHAPIHGVIDLEGELQVVTACPVPGKDAVLAVYLSDASVDRSVWQLVQPVFQTGYALTAFILGATSIVTVFLVSRYETSLALTNANLEQEVQRRTESLLRTRNAVVFGLAKLAESRDCDTGRHLERIRSYVTLLAAELARGNREIDR
ncbi:MAG: hypothetical protein KDA61_20935, partial [Planctomycetales bacterium]|nr:hypothetical protein [Planctomycetales bacterium]